MSENVAEATAPPTPGAAIAVRRPGDLAAAIPAKLRYAQALADSGLLPSQFRRQPGNVLYAVEYGEMLGLAPMAAITGIHVIEGKPTASAGLISALVRRAGHKLRVKGNALSATCQIVRSDDPDFTYEVTWTLRKNKDGNPNAEEAQLLGKDVWKKYAASMLKSRAITQCARDACEEALFGLHYTAEELGAETDEDGNIIGQVVSGMQPGPVPVPENWDTDEAYALSQTAPDDVACRKLWKDAATAARAGLCSDGDAAEIQARLKVRMHDLQSAADSAPAGEDDGVVDAEIVSEDEPLGTDAPWDARISRITGPAGAMTLRDDLNKAYDRGDLDAEQYSEIGVAIDRRLAEIHPQQEESQASPEPEQEPDAQQEPADAEMEFLRDFTARAAETESVGPMKVELARALHEKRITAETAKDLGDILQHRQNELRSAA